MNVIIGNSSGQRKTFRSKQRKHSAEGNVFVYPPDNHDRYCCFVEMYSFFVVPQGNNIPGQSMHDVGRIVKKNDIEHYNDIKVLIHVYVSKAKPNPSTPAL